MVQKTIGFIEQEEYYQNFRLLIDAIPPAQQESSLELFRNLSKLTKKQLSMLGGFTMRYQHEKEDCDTAKDENMNTQSAIYSILEILAERKGITVEKRRLEEELGPGSWGSLFSNLSGDPIIALDTELSGKELNQEFAVALGYSQIMVEGSGYNNMITCKDKAKVATFNKQVYNFRNMLLEAIQLALMEGGEYSVR